MRPVRTARSNFVWLGPTPDIGDLHAEIDKKRYLTRSIWTLTEAERQAIANGANVALEVTGQHPPVSLAVTDEQGVGEDAPEILGRLEEWQARQAEATT